MSTIANIDFDNECREFGRWGSHPYWGLFLKYNNAKIVAINHDGSVDVTYQEPLKPYGELTRITVDVFECTDYWLSDEMKQHKINILKKNFKVGMTVHLNEYRNLFYIHIWEKEYCFWGGDRVTTKMKFKKGEPHYGTKTEFRIDAEMK
jgi:hypothetical protein